jgi:hypothetical protein
MAEEVPAVSRPEPIQSPVAPVTADGPAEPARAANAVSAAIGVPGVADPAVADPSLAAELDRLRAEVARLEEENRAYVRAMRHMTAAAEDVLADARREAAETRARVAAEAYERLTVARADARAAVYEERRRLAAELELLAAVREKITEERTSLTQFHSHLNVRLRQLVHAMVDFTDRSPQLEAAPAQPVPSSGARHEDDVIDTVAEEKADLGSNGRERHPLLDTITAHDEELEEAFAAFFSADIDMEPSRTWILNDQ